MRRVLWISDFPIEWMPCAPEEIRALPRQHPLTWMRVLCEELQTEPDVELHIAVLRKNFPRDLTFKNGRVTFHLRKVPGGLRAPTLFWIDTMVLRKLAREIRPDVVHAWGSEKGAALAASRMGLPYVATVQGLLGWYAELVPLNKYERFASLLERFSLPRAPLVTTESNAAMTYLAKHYPHMQTAQVEHAPNPLFHEIQRQPQTAPLRLLFVGGADYRKGVDLLIAAAASLAKELDFELVMVGGIHPSLAEQWEALSCGPLKGRTTLKRNLRPEEIAEELSTATLLVFPTRADTSPNAVKEAAVAGVPVIGTRVGGIVDYIEDGKNGLLIDSGDATALTEAIRKAAAHPLFSRGLVDETVLVRVREYLSARRMRDGFLAAYERVAGGK